MMKKIAGVVFSLVLIFCLCACGNSTDDLRQKISDLENQIKQQSNKILDLENELKKARASNTESQERVSQLEDELRFLKGEFTADDFLLTIVVDKSTVVQGETLTITATLENKTGRSFFYYAWAENLISNFEVTPYWNIDYFNVPVDPPYPPVDLTISLWNFDKDGCMQSVFELKTYDGNDYQETGVYEITAWATYFSPWIWVDSEYYYIRIPSNTIEITVV